MTRNRATVVAVLFVVLALLRLLPTYHTFAATADEATHVGAGLELLQVHRYQLQPANPPAARLVLALAPQLGGMRFDPAGDYGAQLHSVFYGPHGGKYEHRLLLARISNVLFLMLAAATLFFLMRREAGDVAALLSVFL